MSLGGRGMLLWWVCSTDCDHVSRIEYLCTTMEIIQLDNDDGSRDLIILCGYNDATS